MLLLRKQLPSYSTERFYLLSELENLCGSPLGYIEHDNSPPQSCDSDTYWGQNHVDENTVLIVYVLWNTSHGENDLYDSIKCTLGTHGANSTPRRFQRIIAVEATVSGELFPATADVEVYTKEIQNVYDGYEVIVGLSNNHTAAPALDAAFEYLKETISECATTTVKVVTLRNENYLGGDAFCEPDAVSGIRQYVLSTLEYEWMLSNDDNVGASKQMRNHVDYTRIHAVLFMLVICIGAYLYSMN
jgi:hypothetical protein